MKFSVLTQVAAACGACVILAACGGGSGGGAGPWPIALQLPAPAPANPDPTPPEGTDPAPAPLPQPLACNAETLSTVSLTDAQVVSAEWVEAGAANPRDLGAFCRVKGQATPTPSSLIFFELWMPDIQAWNGKVVVTGNGGYSSSMNTGDMAYAFRQGYAVVGGDTGHQGGDMEWGINQPEKIKDWGTRSINAITHPAKALAEALAAKGPQRTYYYGCSTGGHQGYASIQRYPADFDGVIAGAPGNNRTRLNVEFLHRFVSNRAPGTNTPTILTNAKANLITQRVTAACDALDGVTDGVVDDPRMCTTEHFNIESLQCTGGDEATCLTPAQVEAAKKIYEGPKNPRTGEQIYPGQPVGTESGWPSYWGNQEPVRANYWRQWVYNDPQWDWWSFDFDHDLRLADFVVSPLVDHVDPDISAFKTRGGKAIVYHGWQDAVVNALDTIDYYEKVRNAQGSQEATDEFFRLFLVPGMGHCSGGAGPNRFGNQNASSPTPSVQHDVLMALDHWVETGSAPNYLIASRVSGNTVTQTRPLCAYPKKAIYDNVGDVNLAASFACR